MFILPIIGVLLVIWIASILIREEYYFLGYSAIVVGFVFILYMATLAGDNSVG